MRETAGGLSRRAFAFLLSGTFLSRRAWPSPDAGGTLAWDLGKPPRLSLEQRYRADAHVLLLGVPLMHREGVGGASIFWREFESGDARFLEFTGFSAPERAAGLNRLGFIREMAWHARSGICETIYFGLMTASPEESAEAARNALHSQAKDVTYVAIDGHIGRGSAETSVAQFTAPATMSGSRTPELLERARQALVSAKKVVVPHPPKECSQTFLQALAELLLARAQEDCRFSYSGRCYRMRVTRSVDAKATAYFRQRRVVDGFTNVVQIYGHVQLEEGGKETVFRLWISNEAERPMPLRIEYRPKSYLRLTFEAVAA